MSNQTEAIFALMGFIVILFTVFGLLVGGVSGDKEDTADMAQAGVGFALVVIPIGWAIGWLCS